MSTKNEILAEIKKYIAIEKKDMYTYEDMSKDERIKTEKIISALTDEKINLIIEAKNIIEAEKEHELCDIICDIFENILYRISNKEWAFLFSRR